MFLKLYQRYTSSLTKIRQQFPLSFNKTSLQAKKSNILPMQSALIGLDINTNSVTWAQIHLLPNQPALLAAYETLYFEGNVSKILKTLPLSPPSKIALGIALPDTCVQVITLTLGTHLSLWELRKILKEKSMNLLEKPIKEIYFQYQVLGFVKNQPNHLQFLLVAVLKKTLYDHLHLLKTNHLKPQLIDVESFARERGETILKNQQLQLAPHLQNFLQDADRLAISIGLAMHPCLKK